MEKCQMVVPCAKVYEQLKWILEDTLPKKDEDEVTLEVTNGVVEANVSRSPNGYLIEVAPFCETCERSFTFEVHSVSGQLLYVVRDYIGGCNSFEKPIEASKELVEKVHYYFLAAQLQE